MRRGEYTEHDETESKYWPFVFQFPAGKMMWDYCQFSFLLSRSMQAQKEICNPKRHNNSLIDEFTSMC
jgi:hypothetical protein